MGFPKSVEDILKIVEFVSKCLDFSNGDDYGISMVGRIV